MILIIPHPNEVELSRRIHRWWFTQEKSIFLAGKSHHKWRPFPRKSPNKLQVIGCYRRVCLVEKGVDLPCLSLFKKQPLTTGHISWAARKQTASLNTWFSFGGIPTFLTVDSLKRPNTECNQHKASLFTLFWRDYGLLAAIQTNLQVCQTCVFIKTCQNTSKPACVNPWIKITLPKFSLGNPAITHGHPMETEAIKSAEKVASKGHGDFCLGTGGYNGDRKIGLEHRLLPGCHESWWTCSPSLDYIWRFSSPKSSNEMEDMEDLTACWEAMFFFTNVYQFIPKITPIM